MINEYKFKDDNFKNHAVNLQTKIARLSMDLSASLFLLKKNCYSRMEALRSDVDNVTVPTLISSLHLTALKGIMRGWVITPTTSRTTHLLSAQEGNRLIRECSVVVLLLT